MTAATRPDADVTSHQAGDAPLSARPPSPHNSYWRSLIERPWFGAALLFATAAILLAFDLDPLGLWQRLLLAGAGLLLAAMLTGLFEALHQARQRAEALAGEHARQDQRLRQDLASGNVDLFDQPLDNDPTDAVLPLWHLATELIDRERLTALVVRRIQQNEQEIRVEYRITRANGTSRWLELRGHVDRDEDDRPVRFHGLTLDVSERHAVEEQRRQSQSLFNKLFTDSPVAAAMVDSQGRFLRVNPALCKLAGYAAERLLGRSFLDITHPEDRDKDRQGFLRMMTGDGQRYHTIKRFVRPEGSEVCVQLSANLVRGADGQPQFGLALMQPAVEKSALPHTPAAAPAPMPVEQLATPMVRAAS